MLALNLTLFILCLFVLIKSAEYATRYSARIARIFQISEFVFSFFIVAVISAIPEGTISVISALKGVPEFGLGALLGSNVADLTLVFGIVVLLSAKGINVKSKILNKDFFYLALLLFPAILGFDGHFSRVDGILLILGGLFFFFTLSIESKLFKKKFNNIRDPFLYRNAALLILSLTVLLVSANYTLKFGADFANDLGVPLVLIGLTIVAVGTCLPEMLFSIKAIKANHEDLALGDLLGTVITDATILIGVIAIINPFYFNPMIIYVTGLAMFLAGLLTIVFITSDRVLSKREGIYLLVFYAVYLIVEIAVNI